MTRTACPDGLASVIVVDTSALMEVILDAPLAGTCMAVLEQEAEAAISAGTLTETLGGAGRRDRVAGWLLLPYLAWVAFAGVLNWSVARLNAPGA